MTVRDVLFAFVCLVRVIVFGGAGHAKTRHLGFRVEVGELDRFLGRVISECGSLSVELHEIGVVALSFAEGEVLEFLACWAVLVWDLAYLADGTSRGVPQVRQWGEEGGGALGGIRCKSCCR